MTDFSEPTRPDRSLVRRKPKGPWEQAVFDVWVAMSMRFVNKAAVGDVDYLLYERIRRIEK